MKILILAQIYFMSTQTSIPRGTRDFGPVEMGRRNFIFDTIKSVFKLYGYQPIETPAMENLSTLLGKYGDEGDKLLFKILDSGDFTHNLPQADFTTENANKLALKICEKGLRYDLTVPFARFVVQHRNEIVFPFKRYQMQPVWRADKPQKGRYREFYQCDVDVVGSDSLLNEVELIQIIDDVFKRLNIRVSIKLNNRKILTGIAEIIGAADKIIDITVAIDKLDKIGLEKVNEELLQKGISQNALEKLQPIILLSGTNEEKFKVLKNILAASEVGMKGIEETEKVFSYVKSLAISTQVEFDITLARGLNYYTGAIFEVKALDVAIGSICGGGRYDDLTGIFGMKGVSGVGVSFGADRIYDVMLQLENFPKNQAIATQLLFVNFGHKEELHCMGLIGKIRARGINAEIYPESAKMKKQMSYANDKKIPFVAMVGETEMTENTIALKNMETGEQQKVNIEELLAIFANLF